MVTCYYIALYSTSAPWRRSAGDCCLHKGEVLILLVAALLAFLRSRGPLPACLSTAHASKWSTSLRMAAEMCLRRVTGTSAWIATLSSKEEEEEREGGRGRVGEREGLAGGTTFKPFTQATGRRVPRAAFRARLCAMCSAHAEPPPQPLQIPDFGGENEATAKRLLQSETGVSFLALAAKGMQ